jgi:hypothetical protein
MLKIVALLGILGTPIAAQSNQDIEACAAYGGVAAGIMTHRQNGTPISTVLSVVSDDDSDTKQMIMEAFDSTRFHSEARKKRAVDDFRNDIEFRCLRTKG